jgi:hypothetical protein
LQDRLVVELAFHGIHTRAAAEAFLPAFADYNRRFAVPPADAIAAWRRPPRSRRSPQLPL